MLMIQPLFIGTTELLLIGGVALLIFGGKKLPELMRGIGQGVKEFKQGMNGETVGNKEEINSLSSEENKSAVLNEESKDGEQ